MLLLILKGREEMIYNVKSYLMLKEYVEELVVVSQRRFASLPNKSGNPFKT